jgi:drug/metabolite transporter (DMT)-like permease
MNPSRPAALPLYLSLVVGVVTVAFSAIFVRWAGAPGPVSAFYRMAISVVLLAGPFFLRARAGRPLPRRGMRLAVLGGLFFAGDLGLWASGVMLSGASNPTLLANLAPVWVGLGALVLFRERQRPLFWIGVAVTVFGAATVLGMDLLRSPSLGLGSLLGLLGGVFYSAYFLVTQRGRESLDSLSYSWLAALSSSLALLGITLALGLPLAGYAPATYLNFLGLGVVCQVLGYLAVSYALGKLPASIVSPIMLGQPVVTVFLAVPLLGERLSAGQAVGAAALVIGVIVVYRSREARP